MMMMMTTAVPHLQRITPTYNRVSKNTLEMILGPSKSVRTVCPNCNKPNTFTCTRVNSSTIMYHCYSNSCNTKGVQRMKPDLRGLSLDIINAKAPVKPIERVLNRWELLPYLISGISLDRGLEWLYRNNALIAYKKGLYQVYSDPRERRLCIPLYHKGVLVNMMGRAIENGVSPKVKIYNQGGIVPPFICGNGKNIVIVEDFASACHIGTIPDYVGVALLGATLNKEVVIPTLQELNPATLSVALDKDAFLKSLQVADELRYMFDNVRVIPLREDIKRMAYSEMKRVLGIVKEEEMG